jgi:hypothetical protein
VDTECAKAFAQATFAFCFGRVIMVEGGTVWVTDVCGPNHESI